MDMKIEKMPSYRIAYIRSIGPYGISNVQTMEKLKTWAKLNHLFNGKSIILGIAQDNPKIVKPKACRYDTCIIVSDDYLITDNYIQEGNIIGGTYAVFTINHTAKAVQQAWIDIFPELLGQGYQLDEKRPIMERYKVDMVNNHYCEICVPVCL